MIGPELAIIDVATGKLVRFDVRLATTSTPSIVWANPHTLLFTGRTDVDRGMSIWSVGASHGELIARSPSSSRAQPPASTSWKAPAAATSSRS